MLNLAGEAAPFSVAIIAIPILIHGIGIDRYGVLTLIMLAVGYFGVFNLGLGSAASKFIADAAASGDHREIPGFFWTSLLFMFGFGVCGGILVAALSPWLVVNVLKITPRLQGESLHSFYLLALSLPFVLSGDSLNGTLSAFQRFDLINAIRVPSGIFYFIAPLLVLPFSSNLGWIVASIVLVRLASWAAKFALCIHIIPGLRQQFGPLRPMIGPMLRFGGWVTISAMAVPLMEYADRFIIGAMASLAAVAYYAVPYQITNKLRLVPAALSDVMFPALSGSIVRDPARAALIFERSARCILLTLFSPVLFIVTLAPEGLALWLGPSFAEHSAIVMRWLAFAMFINSLARTPYVLLPAAHRPDLVAKLYSAELPGFFLLLCGMLWKYGVAGAAASYAVRTAVEGIGLFIMARGVLPELGPAIGRIARMASVSLAILAVGMVPMTIFTKGIFLAATCALYALACWVIFFEPEEKDFVRAYLHTARVFVIGASE